MVECDGETVTKIRPGIGFLHTGIEKNMEYRSWTQGTTFVTRMDYLTPLFNVVAYCWAVERLLGIEDQIPERANDIRILKMELNRISSHLVCIGTGGMEIGALTVMTIGFREREVILDFIEAVTGLRMNHAYIRPGGVANDLPETGIAQLRDVITWLEKHLGEYADFCNENPIFKGRMCNIAYQDASACLALGVTGPMLRATGYDWDLRKVQPYCGYENYEFDVPTWDTCDAYGRFRVRLAEMWESLKIVKQCADRLEASTGQPVMVDDPKIGWPAKLAIGPDGQGNSHEHIKAIMGSSMEALIHHFKLVTEGFRVPAGQAYVPIESPKGEIACHVVSDGGTKPFRVHMRDPSFNNLQSVPIQCEGGMIADIVVAVGSIDPVMGGVDR
jgi:NADH-quinone oxidoreductase subunit D